MRSVINFSICFALLLAMVVTGSAAIILIPTDYETIQAALDAASDGDTLFVLPGEYTENIDFHGKPVALLAIGGPHLTTLTAANDAAVVTMISGESIGAILAGFTITGGVAAREGYGGGIVIERSSPIIFNNIIIIGNTA